MKKQLFAIIIVLFSLAAKAEEGALNDTYSMYSKFKFGDSVNWDDCLDMKLTIGVDVCKPKWPRPPYPTPTINYSYNDLVAMVEVVPDPWRSYLYKESLYDFGSKANNGIVGKLGINPTIGAGYTGTGKGSATEQVQQHKLESHVWAISDLWRLKTSNTAKACLSLTCKNEDYTGCVLSVVKTVTKMSDGMSDTISSINSNQSADGKGQGIKNGETGQVSYENGEVYEEKNVYGGKDGDRVVGTSYVKVRDAGNYGDSVFGKAASVATSESVIPGMNNAEALQNVIAFAQNPEGYVVGKAVSAGSNAVGSAVSTGASKVTEGAKNLLGIKDDADPLPASTTKGGSKPSEPSKLPASSATSSSSGTGNKVSNNAMGNNSQGNKSAASQIAGGVASNGINKMIEIIDRVTYFNTVELTIQMIATRLPLSIHPIYMSERHPKPSSDGGFFWSPIFQTFADKGAGLVMPLFCMSKMLTMSVDGVASMLINADFNILGKLGGLGSFIENRCVGSWGPLEPRVTMIGAGDPYVAAGLASVRGLNIAQNITGSNMNQTINNTPFSQLKFNLDWPHQSSCYSFQGFSGLSRGWTTPLGSALDNVSNAVKSGDLSKVGAAAFDTAVKPATKQGGYVFTYWRNRKCKYLLFCDEWKGDTGL